jgi:CheY-like chemotaxis protein
MLFAKRKRSIQRLLIVEDEPLVAFDNEHFLTDSGYVVVGTVDNAPEAVALFAAGGIDLILSDMKLAKGTSGRDVALAAKQADIPLIFVTATCPIDAPQIALGCLAKPYSQRDLKLAIDAIDMHLGGEDAKRIPKGLTLY